MLMGARHVVQAPTAVCLTAGEYHGLITAIVMLFCLLFFVILAVMFAYRQVSVL